MIRESKSGVKSINIQDIFIHMDVIRVLDKIPDYKEFLTVDELDQSSVELADEFDTVNW